MTRDVLATDRAAQDPTEAMVRLELLLGQARELGDEALLDLIQAKIDKAHARRVSSSGLIRTNSTLNSTSSPQPPAQSRAGSPMSQERHAVRSEKLSKRRKEAEERRRNEREASPERKARLRRQKLEERERALQAMEAELREEEVARAQCRPVLVSGSGPSDNPLDDAMAQEDPAQAIVLTRDARPMPFV